MSYALHLFVTLLLKCTVICHALHNVPAMACKGLPCKRAPEVNLYQLVQSIESGLGTHKLLNIYKGAAPLVSGWDMSWKSHHITNAIMDWTKTCWPLWPRSIQVVFGTTQLQPGFEKLRMHVGIWLKPTQRTNLSKQWAMTITQYLQFASERLGRTVRQ